jgi:very-short-patch-repair endonuclease
MINIILEKLKTKGISIKENIIIDDNNETITSRIDGTQRKRIYGRYLKSLGLTSEEYKILFPDAPLMCKKDLNRTTINSGKHMKEDKYRQMFSKMFCGEKNPNHKTKTTQQQRKERSPFSDEFYKKKYKNIKENEIKIIKDNFIIEALKDREFDTRLEYYTDRGYTLEESKQKLKERQQTFTLEKCMIKYGDEEGKKIHKNRQINWQKTLLENGNLKCGYSQISQELFYEILNYYNIDDKKDIYFATKNQEYFLSGGLNSYYQYDFLDNKNKKIIEYNGDCYHANPKIYEKNDHPHPFKKQLTAEQIWTKDEDKLSLANERGFEVLVIWDNEYKKNKEEVIKKCYNFLFNL